MLGNVHVEGRAAVEILHIILTMELELVNHSEMRQEEAEHRFYAEDCQ